MRLSSRFRPRGHPDPVKVKLRLPVPRGLGSHKAARFISDLAAGRLRWSARSGSEAGPSWAWMLLPAPISSRGTGPQASPPSPTSARSRAPCQAKTEPCRAAQLIQFPPRGECPSIGRLMKITTHACAGLPVLPVENTLHISSPETFPHSTQRK